jgi:hypothetical protein
MYMAEFLRLYEHYRARIKSDDPKTFKLLAKGSALDIPCALP